MPMTATARVTARAQKHMVRVQVVPVELLVPGCWLRKESRRPRLPGSSPLSRRLGVGGARLLLGFVGARWLGPEAPPGRHTI